MNDSDFSGLNFTNHMSAQESIFKKFYRNVLGVVLYQPYKFCPNRGFSLVAMATERLNF